MSSSFLALRQVFALRSLKVLLVVLSFIRQYAFVLTAEKKIGGTAISIKFEIVLNAPDLPFQDLHSAPANSSCIPADAFNLTLCNASETWILNTPTCIT